MDKKQYKAYLSTLPQSYLVDLMISLQEQNEALSKAVNEYKATQAEMADMFEKFSKSFRVKLIRYTVVMRDISSGKTRVVEIRANDAVEACRKAFDTVITKYRSVSRNDLIINAVCAADEK